MKRIDHLLAAIGLERRVTDYSPFAPGNWNVARHPGAGYVSAGSVLSNLAVAARCVSLRSELLASVPLKLYRRLPNGDRERVTDSPLANVLADLANPLTTAFEAREFSVRSLDTAGNSYARIERDAAGQVVALWPLEASRVLVERLESGRLRYRYSGDRGPIVLLQEEVLHIRASTEDGLIGRSPIAIARGALGLGLELKNLTESMARDGLLVNGFVMQPVETSLRARKDRAAELDQDQRTGGLRVLDPGVKFVPTQFNASDSEVLESRKLSNEDVARIFGVPPASVGISQSVSYGSAQQAAQDLVTNALAPLASRIEQALMRCCLSAEARRTLIIEHDLAGLLRSAPETQMTTFRTAREAGIYSVNECRRMLNMSAVEGGDSHEPLSLQERAPAPIASERP